MAKVSVGTTAEQLPVKVGSTVALMNLGPGIVYLGWDDEVTAANGLPIAANAGYEFPRDLSRPLWAIASAESDLRYLVVG